MREVTLVYGPPCSGKSTYVQEWAQSDDVVLDLDAIAQELGSRDRWIHTPQLARAANRVWRERAAVIGGQGNVRAWVIRGCPSRQERRMVAGLVRATSSVLLLPDVQTLMSRAYRRPQPQRTLDAISSWRGRFVPDPGGSTAGAVAVPRAVGHRYRRARAFVLAASDVCHWCGHPGADQADHLVPRSVDPTQDVADPMGMAPIHGVHGCPYCPRVNGKQRCCNQERGNRTSDLGGPQVIRRSQDW